MLKKFRLESREKREHLTVLITLTALALFESRCTFLQIGNYLGQGEFKYSLLPFSLKEKFHYLPLLILDSFSLPSPYALSILSTFYHILGAFFMFVFAKEYLKTVFPSRSISSLASYMAMLVYMFYPWNIMGDAFPTLIFVRSLTPLSLLLLMKALANKSYATLLMTSSVSALMFLADPRSLLFLVPISFCIILLPPLHLASTIRKKLQLLFIYFSYLIITFSLSSIEIVYRLIKHIGVGVHTIPITVPSVFNLSSFICNFWYATPLDIMRGISFFATHIFFQEFVEEKLSLSFSLIGAGQLFISISAMLVPLLYLKRGDKKYRSYVMPMLVMLVITILLFSNITSKREMSLNSLPILPRLLFAIIDPKSPEIFKSIAILFRTTRFLNFVYSIVITLLTGLAIEIIVDMNPSMSLLLLCNGWLHHTITVKLVHILTSLLLINILLWSLPMIILGTGPTRPHPFFEISDQTMAYSNIVSQLKLYPSIERAISVHDRAGGLPHLYFLHGVEGGVKQFAIRYTVDSHYSPVLKDSDYDLMAEIISRLGIKYVVLNGYRMSSDNFAFIGEGMNNSQSFKFRVAAGQLLAFEVQGNDPVTITSSGIFVLGGLEDYRTVFPLLRELTNNTVVPIFMDSSFIGKDILTKSSWPLLITPHKSIFDLIAPFAMFEKHVIVVTPSKWTKCWNRFENWSPGYITDTIGGDWSCILDDLSNYEWSYSYRPDYGYAWVINAHDVLTTEFSSESGTYHLMARVIKSPRSGMVKFKLDEVMSEIVVTRWNYSSSEFVWIDLGEHRLVEGRHVLSIENIDGINAINLILLIPNNVWKRALGEAERFLQERDILYLIDLDKQHIDTILGTSSGLVNIMKGANYSLVIRAYNLSEVFLNWKTMRGNESITLSNGFYPLQARLPGVLFASSFEEWNASQGGPDSWITPRDYYKGSLDSTTTVHGKYSYLITTNSSEPGKWSWIRSPNIPVKSGAKYLITTHMKWNNVRQSHIVIEGVRYDGHVIRLCCLPYGKDGSSDWKEFKREIIIPEDVKEICIILNAGWVYNASLGSAMTWFDAISVREITPETHKTGIVLLYSSEKPLKDIISPNPSRLEIISTKTNIYDSAYSEYSITLQMNGSAIIVIPEVFDGAWQIDSQSDVEIHPIPAYYILSGFYLNSKDGPKGIKITIYNSSNRVLRLTEYASFITIGIIMISYVVWSTKSTLQRSIWWLRKRLRNACTISDSET